MASISITITVNHQLDKCGDEFLDERNFEITFKSEADSKFVVFTIDGMENCFIERSDLVKVLDFLTKNNSQ